MRPKIFTVFILALPLLLRAAAAQTVAVSTTPVRIAKIIFHGNRTAENILRKHLPFSEGDALGASTLQDAKAGLWDMRQFKQVEVSSAALPGDSAEVDITVADGWYLLPLPFFSGGSGL